MAQELARCVAHPNDGLDVEFGAKCCGHVDGVGRLDRARRRGRGHLL